VIIAYPGKKRTEHGHGSCSLAAVLPRLFLAVLHSHVRSSAVQMIAPGKDVRPGHLPELLDAPKAGKSEALPAIPLVILPGVAVAQIGEPLGLRHGGQRRELGAHKGVAFFSLGIGNRWC